MIKWKNFNCQDDKDDRVAFEDGSQSETLSLVFYCPGIHS